MKFVINHGILPVLPPNFTKFVLFLVTPKDLSSDLKSFPKFSTNVTFAKSGSEKVMENQEMAMEKYFVKSVGTLLD